MKPMFIQVIKPSFGPAQANKYAFSVFIYYLYIIHILFIAGVICLLYLLATYCPAYFLQPSTFT